MTSPPGSHPQLPHPSPSGNLMPSSPLNPQPSPMTAHSPGPNLAYMQSHPDSSPFAAMSPAAANWPGSPRPSPRPGQSPEHKLQPQGRERQRIHFPPYLAINKKKLDNFLCDQFLPKKKTVYFWVPLQYIEKTFRLPLISMHLQLNKSIWNVVFLKKLKL